MCCPPPPYATSSCSSARVLVWFVCINVRISQFLCCWNGPEPFQFGFRSPNTAGQPSSHIRNQILQKGLFVLRPSKPPGLRPELNVYRAANVARMKLKAPNDREHLQRVLLLIIITKPSGTRRNTSVFV